MGVVRVDSKLVKDIKKWIKENGNRYQCPTMSAFVNMAIYEKLNALNKKGRKK